VKKVLKIIITVYAIVSMVIVTVLIIGAVVIRANFSRITSFAIEKTVDNFNAEINDIISSHLAVSVKDNSISFESLKTIPSGGLQASFNVDSSALSGIDMQSYQDKSNSEIISDLGITLNDIPQEVITFLKMAGQTLVLDFKDRNGNEIINRALSTKEIEDFLRP
jgi:hypothetical protein